MRESKAPRAGQRVESLDQQLSEITLPFRIVCTRHDSEEGAIETRTRGRSLLEPRDDVRIIGGAR